MPRRPRASRASRERELETLALIEDLPENVVGVEAHCKLTADAYLRGDPP
jgi:hypothetical protein